MNQPDPRDRIAAWVREHCWSESRQAYTMHPGTERLDAAVILAARFGFDEPERLASTVDAVRTELGRGPFLYRYSGAEDEEGAFLACSFWLVEALATLGRGSFERLLKRSGSADRALQDT